MNVNIIYDFACKLIRVRFYQTMPPRVRGGYLQAGGSVRRRYNLRRRRNQRGKGIGANLSNAGKGCIAISWNINRLDLYIFYLHIKTTSNTDTLLTNDENKKKSKDIHSTKKKSKQKNTKRTNSCTNHQFNYF